MYFLLTPNIVFLKKVNPDPILAVKIIERRKFIDYFGLSIEADPYRLGKKNGCFFLIEYIPIPLSVKLHTARHQLGKELNV